MNKTIFQEAPLWGLNKRKDTYVRMIFLFSSFPLSQCARSRNPFLLILSSSTRMKNFFSKNVEVLAASEILLCLH